MLRIAIDRAQEKLDQASAQIDGLKSTSMDNRTVRDSWSAFLFASNRVFSLLEQGAKSSPRSKEWFSRHRELRKSDPLLRYVHQARNADEHGLAHITKLQSSRLELVAGAQVKAAIENLASDNKGQLRGTFQNRGVEAFDPSELTEMRIHPAQPVLISVTNRNVTYEPPAGHLGKSIEYPYPQIIANLMVQYLQQMLDEAKMLAAD